MQQTLKQGLHLCLYPDGTRNKTSEVLQDFYEGAFVTAIRAQKPIMPAILFNTKKIMPIKPGNWGWPHPRSEEHTSELQSRGHLVCRLLLENKKVRTVPTNFRT